MNTPKMHGKFQTLLEEHKRILYKVCNAYSSTPDDRDDLAQEIILQIWRSFHTFDERCRFSTWMYRIALNVAISFSRRECTRTRHVLPGDEHLLDIAGETRNQPEEILLLHQFIERQEALHKALLLLYLDGNSYREIADVLGIRETSVATKLSRLKKTMQQEIGGTKPSL